MRSPRSTDRVPADFPVAQLFGAGVSRVELVDRYGFDPRSGKVWRWLKAMAPAFGATVLRRCHGPRNQTTFRFVLLTPEVVA